MGFIWMVNTPTDGGDSLGSISPHYQDRSNQEVRVWHVCYQITVRRAQKSSCVFFCHYCCHRSPSVLLRGPQSD